jgi:hypothetical protein
VQVLPKVIAGHSALMEANEEATVRDLKAHQALILPLIAKHGDTSSIPRAAVRGHRHEVNSTFDTETARETYRAPDCLS